MGKEQLFLKWILLLQIMIIFIIFFFSQMKLKLREDGENCSEQGSDKK